MCKIATGKRCTAQEAQLSEDLEGWDRGVGGGGGGGRDVQEGGDICIHIADSLHRTAEANTNL